MIENYHQGGIYAMNEHDQVPTKCDNVSTAKQFFAFSFSKEDCIIQRDAKVAARKEVEARFAKLNDGNDEPLNED